MDWRFQMVRDGCFGLSLQPGEPAAEFEGVVAGQKLSELGRFTMFRRPTGILYRGLEREDDGMDVPVRPVPCSQAGARVGLYPVGSMGGAPQPVSAHFGVWPAPAHVADPVL